MNNLDRAPHPTIRALPGHVSRSTQQRFLVAWLTLVVSLLATGSAHAANYQVIGLGDGAGNCVTLPGIPFLQCTTLRAAMTAANASTNADIIFLPEGGTITLTQGQLTVAENSALTIVGGATTTISGGGISRVLNTWAGSNVTLRNLTIADGHADGTVGHFGGGIWNDGNLMLENATVRNNEAVANGGGIFNNGTMTLEKATVHGNRTAAASQWVRQGGGIYNNGILTIRRSTVSNNTTGFANKGGGIFNASGKTLTVEHSTLSGNVSGGYGGALLNQGNATLTFTTVTGNSGFATGGIETEPDATTTLHYSVLAGNSDDDCYASSFGTTHAAWSLIGVGVDCVNGSSFAIFTGDPKLGPLANNGGPTRTHLPLHGSPLIDAIPSFEAESDQRGIPRPQGDALDIGAVEVMVPLFADGFEDN